MELSKKELIARKHEEERKKIDQEEKRKNIIKWVIIGVITVLIGVGVFWIIKESNKPLPGQEVEDQGRGHIEQKEWEKFNYKSNPPTSGPHDAVWTNTGIYDQPQADGHLVHSLEHGYVILSYNCDKLSDQNSCDTVKKQLADIAHVKLWKIVVTPRPNLDVPLALTAWDRIEKFKTVGNSGLTDSQKTQVQAFIDAFRDHGPEATMD